MRLERGQIQDRISVARQRILARWLAPVTPEDVVWSLQRAGDRKGGNPIQFVWGKIGNFKVDGMKITADVKEFEPTLFP